MLDLSNYLYNNLGLDLQLITHNSIIDSSFLKHVKFPLIPILSGSRSDPRTRFASAFSNILTIQRLIQKFQVSKKNIFVNATIDTLFEVRLAAKSKIAAGYNVLGNNGDSALLDLIDRFAMRTSINKIVANTALQKKFYLRLGLDEKSIHLIPHCVDLKRIQDSCNNYQESEKEVGKKTMPTIFYGGRISIEKGIRELLECYQAISQEFPVDLVLVGDGPLRDWVLENKKKIEKESSKSKIRFLAGWQPPEVLLNQMLMSDIVVLPSYHEMNPIILLEAMCLKKAIISTNVGGPNEIIIEGVNGLLINPFIKNDLKMAMVKLVTDSPLRRRLGLRAFEILKTNYEVSIIAPKFLNFLES